MRDLNFLLLFAVILMALFFLWWAIFRVLSQDIKIVEFFTRSWGAEKTGPGILNDWQLSNNTEHIHFQMPSREVGVLKYYPGRSSIPIVYLYFYNAHHKVPFADGLYGEAAHNLFTAASQSIHFLSDLGEYRWVWGTHFSGLVVKARQCLQLYRLPFFYRKTLTELQAQFFNR